MHNDKLYTQNILGSKLLSFDNSQSNYTQNYLYLYNVFLANIGYVEKIKILVTNTVKVFEWVD